MSEACNVDIITFNLKDGGAGPDGSYSHYNSAIDFIRRPENQADIILIQEGNRWLEDDRRRLYSFADAAGLAVANTEEPLTGCCLITLYNHARLRQHSGREIEGPEPYWHGVALADFSERNSEYPDALSFRVVNRHGDPFNPAKRYAEVGYDIRYSRANPHTGGGAQPSGVALLGGDWNSLAPAAPKLHWPTEEEASLLSEKARRRYITERGNHCLVDDRGEFILDDEGRPQNDRRPRKKLERAGLSDVGTLFNHHPPTAGFNRLIPGPRAIDGFHIAEIAVASMLDISNRDNFQRLGTEEEITAMGDHGAVRLRMDIAPLRDPTNFGITV